MTTARMPALFLGHGSPMNVLENSDYTACWQQLGKQIPKPRAIIVISAHWYTRGAWVTAMPQPKTIHDFGGFPQALYQIQYPAPGAPKLAEELCQRLSDFAIQQDLNEWGLDHGSWGVLYHLYPNADIPVIQLSLDGTQPESYHYRLGQALSAWRDEGVLLLGSGNVVHNLRQIQRQPNAPAYDWAERFEQFVVDNLTVQGKEHPLIQYLQHPDGLISNPSAEHYLPLLYILGCWDGHEPVSVPLKGITMGSLSMLSVKVG